MNQHSVLNMSIEFHRRVRSAVCAMCISDINVQCPRLLEETPSTEDVGRRATQHCSGVVPGENSNFESCVMRKTSHRGLYAVCLRDQ